MRDKVSILKATDYKDVTRILEDGIKHIGGLKIRPGEKVVIKPNLCGPRASDTGATTSIVFIKFMIEYINKKLDGDCTITIVESDAQGIDADFAFEHFELNELAKQYQNVHLTNLTKDVEMRITVGDGKAFDVLELPNVFLECTYFISLSKLKTHVDQRITCSLKNQFGCITKKYKSIFHPFLSETIYDVNNLYRPDLSIIDGIIGMEGFGPTDGTPKRANLVIFGTNPIATDMVAAEVMGFRPETVPHLFYAMKQDSYSKNSFDLVYGDISAVASNFEFIGTLTYKLGRVGLITQRIAQYKSSFGEFIQKVRSAIALVGYDTIQQKVCYRDMFKIAHAMIFRFSR